MLQEDIVISYSNINSLNCQSVQQSNRSYNMNNRMDIHINFHMAKLLSGRNFVAYWLRLSKFKSP